MEAMGKAIQITGLPGWWQRASAVYRYAEDPIRCPACRGVGIPWAGWFTCQDCPAVALVGDGRVWIPVRKSLADFPDMWVLMENTHAR